MAILKSDKAVTVKETIKRHVMTGISFMLPLVVGAGICMALGYVVGGVNVKEATSGIGYWLYTAGSLGLSLVVPVIAAAIAYSIADRPGIAPGVIVGYVAATIKAGFLGGILGGFLVGYVVLALKRIKVPQSMNGLMPILIIPFFATVICSVLMFGVLGTPISMFMNWLTEWLTSLQGGSKFLYGAIIGAGASIDYGGPLTKTMSAFTTGLLVDGVFEPKACHMLGSSIPPMGVIVAFLLSKVFKKPIFTKVERESVKTCLPMGACMITECVIPIAMNDLVRVVFSSMCASFVAGGLSMVWGVATPVPHGGWFVIPLMTNPLGYVAALAIGSVIMGVILFVLKRPVKDDTQEEDFAALAAAYDDSDDDGELKIEIG